MLPKRLDSIRRHVNAPTLVERLFLMTLMRGVRGSGHAVRVHGQCGQGLTLVHFSAQREHFLWDTLGTFSRKMSHNSSQTGLKTAH